MESDSKIYVAGHRGLVGSALVRLLKEKGYTNLILKTHQELDLTSQVQVREFFEREAPEYVFDAAAKVGGIKANSTEPAHFIFENLMIQSNLMSFSMQYPVKKLLFLGSSCIYPRDSPQPIREEYLLSSHLEETNKPYAVAKIAGVVMAQAYRKQYGCNYISAMPTNLYGPNDNFDLESSHVLPALIRRFHEAKVKGEGQISLWGSGRPRREFLHVDDLAKALLILMDEYDSPEPINIGYGTDVTINELAEMIGEVTGFDGKILFDVMNPDGTPQKLLDSSRMKALGWKPKISLREGLEKEYQWFLDNECLDSS